MASRARQLARQVFARIDHWYGRRFALLPLGPALLLGRELYQGETREFADGTRLLAKQPIGILHLNNCCLAGLKAESRHVVGVRFARLFRDSLRQLAESAQRNPEWHDVTVFHGLTWFRHHGEKVGFISEPLPAGWRQRLLSRYFHLLAWGYSPVSNRIHSRWQPRRFWITRAALIKHFGHAAAT